MVSQLELRHFSWKGRGIEVYVPVQANVQRLYWQNRTDIPFPYWAQVWPAAIAMCEFLVSHLAYIRDKKVLELAAGLGLPSLVAAPYAAAVCCSDYLAEPSTIVEQSIAHHRLTNIDCRILNWHSLPTGLNADTLLLSDINYDPEAFQILHKVLMRFLFSGTAVILSTPQRLMAKSFIGQLLPYCIEQQEITVLSNDSDTIISIFVLQKMK
jgi:predicted nicotinamide N-methyase